MKKFKKAAAILGVAVLLIACLQPFFFAFGKGENAEGAFRASMGVAIMTPVIAYAFWMVYRLLAQKNKKADSEIKNIIFDVGQVLVHYEWKPYLKGFGFPEEEYQAIAEKVFESPIWNERDRGLLSEEEYEEQFAAALPQYAADVRRVVQESARTISRTDYAQTWTKYLKSQGYRLFVLSNYCEYTLERTMPDMDFLENMDGVIFSCDVKQIKPEPEIYRTLLTRYSLNPSECVFLDDRAENCEAAQKQGIRSIQFKNLKQAAAELEKLGVK